MKKSLIEHFLFKVARDYRWGNHIAEREWVLLEASHLKILEETMAEGNYSDEEVAAALRSDLSGQAIRTRNTVKRIEQAINQLSWNLGTKNSPTNGVYKTPEELREILDELALSIFDGENPLITPEEVIKHTSWYDALDPDGDPQAVAAYCLVLDVLAMDCWKGVANQMIATEGDAAHE